MTLVSDARHCPWIEIGMLEQYMFDNDFVGVQTDELQFHRTNSIAMVAWSMTLVSDARHCPGIEFDILEHYIFDNETVGLRTNSLQPACT